MRIFKTKRFHKWMKRVSLNNEILKQVIDEIERGLYEARLGRFLIKKRVKLDGRGKRGGARTIIAFKKADKAFFVFGYTKNERSNIDDTERESLNDLAMFFLTQNSKELARLIEANVLTEIEV